MGPYEYIVTGIEGDYAYLERTDLPDQMTPTTPREPVFIAMALLPEGTTIGTKLRWENLEYTILCN